MDRIHLNSNEKYIIKNTIGVYPVGALSISFYKRMNANFILCRKNSPTTNWLFKSGRISINSEFINIEKNAYDGLACKKPLPELIIVSPTVNQLNDFLDELIDYLYLLVETDSAFIENIPYFLLASSGIYFEKIKNEFETKFFNSNLTCISLSKEIISRRIFRAVAYQAAVRTGSGNTADYITGNEESFLVLSLSGTPEARARILSIFNDRNYPIQVEKSYLESEYDKALVNIIYNAFSQLYSVNKNRFLNVSAGDLFSESEFLPAWYKPQNLRDNPETIRKKMVVISTAFVETIKAAGIYAANTKVHEKLLKIEEYILKNIPDHVSSSLQLLIEKLINPSDNWKGTELLPTEESILFSLIKTAKDYNIDTVNVFSDVAAELIQSYSLAVSIRDNPAELLELLSKNEKLSPVDLKILKFQTQNALKMFQSGINKTCFWSETSDFIPETDLRFCIEKVLRNFEDCGFEETIRKFKTTTTVYPGKYSFISLFKYFIPLAIFIEKIKVCLKKNTLILGLNGLPGCGKTTAANILSDILSTFGNDNLVATVSIDDFYYSKKERADYNITEWGPGSHDPAFGEKLKALCTASKLTPVTLPVFDKQIRDRSVTETKHFSKPASYVLFEGFGVGMRSNNNSAFSDQIDLLISLTSDMDECKLRRKSAGWNDQREFFDNDFKRYNDFFEITLWPMIEKQTLYVMPEVENFAHLIIPVCHTDIFYK
ncbi:hypothetical protein KKF34_18180 [Myxococcota bacterium]|nr:hypothetical protein [Myxococcota bacterium]MBU1380705.1 hypothetical protein [Myxococcota bacterium]MBU1498814.1 hypothetical protein [Myxococcota bacterium]